MKNFHLNIFDVKCTVGAQIPNTFEFWMVECIPILNSKISLDCFSYIFITHSKVSHFFVLILNGPFQYIDFVLSMYWNRPFEYRTIPNLNIKMFRV